MKRLRYGAPGFEREMAALYRRPAYPPEAEKSAAEIIADIRKNGDSAIAKYAEKFDGVKLKPAEFRVTDAEVAEAVKRLPAADKRARDADDGRRDGAAADNRLDRARVFVSP